MTTQTSSSVVGVFHDRARAEQAVQELKRAGFRDDQIGVIARGSEHGHDADSTDSYIAEGAATGLATGAGIGALWGLGALAGVLPVIGPAIAGGTLAALLSSAAAGAAAAGLGGALIGMGIPKDEAEYYEGEVHAGRILVTVAAAGRDQEARRILNSFGSYDAANRAASSTQTAAGAQRSAQSTQTQSASSRTATSAQSAAACSTSSPAMGAGSVRAVEEKLSVHKTPVQTGEVEVRKEVHHETKTIEVPVTREEVVIERRNPIHETCSPAASGREEIRIPVKEDQVRVEKTPVVKEEVSVSKRRVEGTERVSETLRKEDIKVETRGNAKVSDAKTGSKK